MHNTDTFARRNRKWTTAFSKYVGAQSHLSQDVADAIQTCLEKRCPSERGHRANWARNRRYQEPSFTAVICAARRVSLQSIVLIFCDMVLKDYMGGVWDLFRAMHV